jgi:hypothetical protein
LKLLCDEGWWLGAVLVLFLWWTHVSAFEAASKRTNDPYALIGMMAPYAAIFISVGLTGQSVLNASFVSNGLVTLAFPGIIYGATLNYNKRSLQKKFYAYPLA